MEATQWCRMSSPCRRRVAGESLLEFPQSRITQPTGKRCTDDISSGTRIGVEDWVICWI